MFQGGSSLRNVFKKFSKLKKRPRSFPICPNVFWTRFGVIFMRKFFAQCSKEGRVFEMFLKNFQTSKKRPKSFPIRPSVFWTCFGVIFLKNFLAQCSKEGPVSKMFLENLLNSKNAQNRSQKWPNVFWTCFGLILLRNFSCPVFHGGSSLRNVFKKFSNFKKTPKIVPKLSKSILNVFWGTFRKVFLPSVPRRVQSSKCF